MKLFISLIAVYFVTGCSTISQYKELWPRDHDPSLVAGYVDLQQKLDAVECSDKNTVNEAIFRADWLNKYAYFRKDPQRVTTNTIVQNLNKAAATEEAACKRWINLANINMKTLQKSWSAR